MTDKSLAEMLLLGEAVTGRPVSLREPPLVELLPPGSDATPNVVTDSEPLTLMGALAGTDKLLDMPLPVIETLPDNDPLLETEAPFDTISLLLTEILPVALPDAAEADGTLDERPAEPTLDATDGAETLEERLAD